MCAVSGLHALVPLVLSKSLPVTVPVMVVLAASQHPNAALCVQFGSKRHRVLAVNENLFLLQRDLSPDLPARSATQFRHRYALLPSHRMLLGTEPECRPTPVQEKKCHLSNVVNPLLSCTRMRRRCVLQQPRSRRERN
ncbi:hypothetical protein BU23DRAFT_95445 [Bimuria novae-zelandiae CBS 107.79]|uniref:Secreted protein n=1 Tax=Bimuria novae-zelandiae CBS 107.79 TaxID=1447943 RepID=A0A6A5VBP8_9PLEO|nr:hypothetical protein BU23DRAFT_95445 [Bimuria novae-zelandiae CBS 107.79]